MITEEKMNKIYDKVAAENTFTTKELIAMGFTKDDLTKLVKDEILMRVKRGEYRLIDVEKLYVYGRSQIKINRYKAERIFEACHKINPYHGGALFQLFLKNINKENLEEAFKYLDLLIKNGDEYERDYNVYLYLFDQIYSLPPNYHDHVQALTEDDLLVLPSDKRFEDKDYQNQIRRAIYYKKNAIVNNLLFNYNPDNLKVFNIVIRRILTIAYKKQTELNKLLIELIENEDFEKIVELLSIERNQNSLTPTFYYILIVTRDILEIKRTGIIPEVTDIKTNNFLKAIDFHNYALALYLSKEYNASRNKKDNDVALTLILKAIMYEIRKIENCSNGKENLVAQIEEDILNKNIASAMNNLTIFLSNIKKEDYEILAINFIRLNLLRKKKNISNVTRFLSGLIIDEINIDISELINEYKISLKDSYQEKLDILIIIFRELEKLGVELPESYRKLFGDVNSNIVPSSNDENEQESEEMLRSIENGLEKREIPSILKYLKEYLISINKSEFEYLAILLIKLCFIRKSNNYESIIIFLAQLRNNTVNINIAELVKEYEISFKNKNNEKASLLLSIIKELEKLGIASDITSGLEVKVESNTEKRESEVAVLPVTESPKEVIKPDLPKQVEITPEIKDFMNSIYQRLEEDELIILSEEDSLRLDITIFNKEYRKAHAFKIGTNGLVVVKRTRYVNPSEAFEHTRNGDEAFNNGNWEEAIKEYKELLPLKQTFTRVYANLGLAYMNLGNIPEAIKYLTIANGLSEINPLIKFDYRKLINELKAKLSASIKTEQNYGIENTNLNDYYGVAEVNEVADLINQGKNIEEACQALNITTSERNMIGLLLARDCYARGDFESGDDYIRQIEENPHKSKQVIKFLKSIKQNRLLYQTRVNEDYKPLLSKNLIISDKTPQETKRVTKVSLNKLFEKIQTPTSSPEPKQEPKTKSNSNEDLMARRYQELKAQGDVMLLKSKDVSKFDVEEFNRRYKDAYAFYIGLGAEKKIVIKVITKSYINIRELEQRAKAAFSEGDYETAILENKKIIMYYKKARPITYGSLGLAYLKRQNTYAALKYFEIATGLAQALGMTGFDYTDLINKIKGVPAKEVEDTKVNVRMSESEFSSDIDDYYGVKRLNEIVLLMNFHGMSVKDACDGLCLNSDETNKIILVLAKECYALGEYEMGDRYLLEVERSPKSQSVKQLVSEIRNNRRFYRNRVDENYQPLIRERTLRV